MGVRGEGRGEGREEGRGEQVACDLRGQGFSDSLSVS